MNVGIRQSGRGGVCVECDVRCGVQPVGAAGLRLLLARCTQGAAAFGSSSSGGITRSAWGECKRLPEGTPQPAEFVGALALCTGADGCLPLMSCLRRMLVSCRQSAAP